MSQLTAALERLDRAITAVETCVESRLAVLHAQQTDLFVQVDTTRDQTKQVVSELDGMIQSLEKILHQAA